MTRDPCTWSARDDVFEGYVRGALSATERDAFEDHYFACATCLAKLRAYDGLRAELGALATEAPAGQPIQARPWRWALVPMAASLVLVAVVALWLRSSAPGVPESTVAVAPAAAPPAAARPTAPVAPAAPVPGPGVAQPRQTAPAPAEPLARPQPAAPPVVALSVLARVEPPPYAPVLLRGPQDEAAAKFDAAMRQYVKRNYAEAVPGLGAAAVLRPDVPQYAFFLAICHLLSGQLEPAVAGLQKAIAIGESPYLEEAHFYLAKAWLGQGDVPAAREELVWTIERGGRLAPDARRLLAQLDALAPRK